MSKELTPSEEVLYKTKIDERFLGQEVYLLKKDTAEKVAKYLKALEIIKEHLQASCLTTIEKVVVDVVKMTFTHEEIDLLKEVLE